MVAGGAAIIAGGIVAAVTDPAGWEHGSWTAAFLVLVAGVAQIGLALGQVELAAVPATPRVALLASIPVGVALAWMRN